MEVALDHIPTLFRSIKHNLLHNVLHKGISMPSSCFDVIHIPTPTQDRLVPPFARDTLLTSFYVKIARYS